jgi:hypothetical protein
VASEKTNARLRLALFVSLLPLFQTSFESRSFQNKNAPIGALFFLAESEGLLAVARDSLFWDGFKKQFMNSASLRFLFFQILHPSLRLDS